MSTTIHPAIQEELDMLRERFPGKAELTLDEYSVYFGIDRHYASQHFNKINRSECKIAHKRLGRKIFIPMIDFAYWLARNKVVDGKLVILPSEEGLREEMKRRRGFSQTKKYDYRKLG